MSCLSYFYKQTSYKLVYYMFPCCCSLLNICCYILKILAINQQIYFDLQTLACLDSIIIRYTSQIKHIQGSYYLRQGLTPSILFD